MSDVNESGSPMEAGRFQIQSNISIYTDVSAPVEHHVRARVLLDLTNPSSYDRTELS